MVNSTIARVANVLGRWHSKPQEIPRIDLSSLKQVPADQNLAEMVRAAWIAGKDIPLSNAVYGPAHWPDGKRFCDEPFTYYYFLAGLVRLQGCRRMVEIGTHFGGSTLAMLHGVLKASSAKIVTIDITDLNPVLHSTPGIIKLTGDANSDEQIKRIFVHFGGEPIDLLFIDADHSFLPTITNFALYVALLRPRLVVIDDVKLNEGMRDTWRVIRTAYGENAIDCDSVIPEVRMPNNVGFGLVSLPKHAA
jgi:hypothetical protein